MKSLPIVVKITAKPGKIAFVKEHLLKLISLTRDEEGCIQYDLHQDNDNSAVFVFYEIWETTELWQKHDQSKHVIDYKKATEDCILSVEFNKLTLL